MLPLIQTKKKRSTTTVYESTFKAITDGELVKGIVVGLTKTDVVINIGFKSDGLVSLNEFRDMPNLKTGDEVEVMVVEKEDREGHLNLSRKQARITRAWERIVEVHKTGEVITGTITQKPKAVLSWMYMEWKPSFRVHRSTLSLLPITISLLVKQWNSKW